MNLVTVVVLVSSYYEWCVTSQTIKLQFFLNNISPGNTFYHTTTIISKESLFLSLFHGRSFTLVLWQKEWLVGATAFSWNIASKWPRWSENSDFQQIFARSASAVTSSEKKFN